VEMAFLHAYIARTWEKGKGLDSERQSCGWEQSQWENRIWEFLWLDIYFWFKKQW